MGKKGEGTRGTIVDGSFNKRKKKSILTEGNPCRSRRENDTRLQQKKYREKGELL